MLSTILVSEGTSVPWSMSVQMNLLKILGGFICANSICLLICKAGTIWAGCLSRSGKSPLNQLQLQSF